jgi:hypothetical protein
LAALRPPVAQPVAEKQMDRLYDMSIVAKGSGQLDYTLALWERIASVNPNYSGGLIAGQLPALRKEIQEKHVKHLSAIAETSKQESIWGRQVAALRALLAIKPSDLTARTQLQIAEQNYNMQFNYQKAVQFVSTGDFKAAKALLEMVWKEAPNYGDPAKLGPQLQMIIPKPSAIPKPIANIPTPKKQESFIERIIKRKK